MDFLEQFRFGASSSSSTISKSSSTIQARKRPLGVKDDPQPEPSEPIKRSKKESVAEASSLDGIRKIALSCNPPAHLHRYWAIVAALLSSRTKASVAVQGFQNLVGLGLEPDSVLRFTWQEIEECISMVHFCKRKAQQIIAATKLIQKRFDGIVPSTERELLEIPGIGPNLVRCVLRAFEPHPATEEATSPTTPRKLSVFISHVPDSLAVTSTTIATPPTISPASSPLSSSSLSSSTLTMTLSSSWSSLSTTDHQLSPS
jgi:hypothetical protein